MKTLKLEIYNNSNTYPKFIYPDGIQLNELNIRSWLSLIYYWVLLQIAKETVSVKNHLFELYREKCGLTKKTTKHLDLKIRVLRFFVHKIFKRWSFAEIDNRFYQP